MAIGKISPLLISKDGTSLKHVDVKMVVKLKVEKLATKRKLNGKSISVFCESVNFPKVHA